MRKTKRLTLAALLAAIALIIFVLEAQIPSLTSIPGVKLGLSNIVTVFALYSLGPVFALFVLLARIILGSLLTGQVMALLYSLAGGMLSFALCTILRRFIGVRQLWVTSTFGAVAHNLGQILAAIFVTATPALIVYLPILILSGIVAGAFTGLCAQFLLSRLNRLGFVPLFGDKSTK